MSKSLVEDTSIAALWEHPKICLAFFGVQYNTQEGKRLYKKSGIEQEIFSAMEEALAEGLLLNRSLRTPEGRVVMQYWRSYKELELWSRRLPHTRWWKWLKENQVKGIGFYHEIYQVKTAEAFYESGTQPVGPALFCSLLPVKGGEGKSKERQQRFADVANNTKSCS